MKGKISIGDFIHQVKHELRDAQTSEHGDPFYELQSVTLEVSFVLDTSMKAGANLYVVQLGSDTSAQQTHKVTLALTPLSGSARNRKSTGGPEQVSIGFGTEPDKPRFG